MRSRRVEITNFRGIEHAVIDVRGHTAFVGPNNSGKTTLLKALDLVLGPGRPS